MPELRVRGFSDRKPTIRCLDQAEDHPVHGAQVARLQEMLEAKQRQLREVLSGGGEGGDKVLTAEERTLLQQKEEYGRRGIR